MRQTLCSRAQKKVVSVEFSSSRIGLELEIKELLYPLPLSVAVCFSRLPVTPRKINIEPENDGLESMIFLPKWVILR